MSAGKYGSGPEAFPSTRWSLVAQAGLEDSQARREALQQLLERYVPALRAHLVQQKRLPAEKADDLVQEFVTGKILEKDLIARADQRLGKLRTFLLTALDRFVKNQLRDERAKKRAPTDGAILSFDDRYGGLPGGQQPSQIFDVAWAHGVIGEALDQMRQECEVSDRLEVWGVFECRVVKPILEGAEPVDYDQLVARFGFRSPTQASNILTTAKRMYARALRAAVGQYAESQQEIESELRELREILAQSGTGQRKGRKT
ncbi:MAG: hypothetical protein JXB62_12670 [Pirellulales bacterium]|nr:hypothetical protein [Pirellulales bacterium]